MLSASPCSSIWLARTTASDIIMGWARDCLSIRVCSSSSRTPDAYPVKTELSIPVMEAGRLQTLLDTWR